MEQGVGRFCGFLADFPNSNSVIYPASGKPLAIRGKRQRVKFLQRLRKRVAPLAGSDIPQLYRTIGAGTGEDLSIRSKRQIEDAPVVAGEGLDFLSRLNFPELDLLV